MYYIDVTEEGAHEVRASKNIRGARCRMIVLGSKLRYGVNEMRAFFYLAMLMRLRHLGF